MRKIIIGTGSLILLYCLYWFAVSLFAPPQLAPRLKNLHEDGLYVRLQTPKITGFPAQFKAPLKQLRIVQYRVPLPDKAALHPAFDYKLEIDQANFSVLAFWPLSQKIKNISHSVLTLPLYAQTGMSKPDPSRTGIKAENLDISISGLHAKQIEIDGENITVTALNKASEENIALRSIGQLELKIINGKTHGALGLTASSLSLHPETLGPLGDGLGTQIEHIDMRLDYTLRLGPDEKTIELMGATLDNASLLWGKAQLSAVGEVTRSDTGLQGEVVIKIDKSADLLAELRRADVINTQQFFSATMMLGSSNETRSLTLNLKDSAVYLGPIRLAKLPF